MSTNRSKRISAFAIRSQSFGLGIQHAMTDAFHALIPVAVAGLAASFLVWFWSNGPSDLMFTLFQVKVGNLLAARILSPIIVGFPPLIFVRSSFKNFGVVLRDTRAMERDMDVMWQRIARHDEAVRIDEAIRAQNRPASEVR